MDKIFLCFLFYILGSIPFAYIFTYLFSGKNILKMGTGNAGVANSFLVGGLLSCILTILGEYIKAILPILISWIFLKDGLAIIYFLFSFIGDRYSLFLHGKGGKARTMTAVSLMLISPLSFALVGIIWLILIIFTRRASFSACTASIAMPIVVGFLEHNLIITLVFILVSIIFCLDTYNLKNDIEFFKNKER